MKNLCWAVLWQTLKDSKKGYDIENIKEFAMSDWCELICDCVSFPVVLYRQELAHRIGVGIDSLKPKRIQTYKLAEVLRNGKDSRKRQGQIH